VSPWLYFTLPAIACALCVRLDAKIIGPYFASSSLIGGWEGSHARTFMERGPLRSAVLRRFLYPVALGFAASWLPLSWWEVPLCGLFAGILLIWPVIFSGLPWGIVRRGWVLPAFYAAFAVSYLALAGFGLSLQRLLLLTSQGDVAGWFADQLLAAILFGALGLFASGAVGKLFSTLTREQDRREEIGREYDYDGNSSFLDLPPEQHSDS